MDSTPMRCLAAALALAAVLDAPPVAAQTPAPVAEPAERVFVVLDDGGTVLAGSLLSLTDTSIALLMTSGPRDIPMDQVVRVERRGDPTLDGAVRGASILGGLCVITCGQGVSNGSHYARVVLSNAVIGAALGWWFDHQHVGRRVVYRRR